MFSFLHVCDATHSGFTSTLTVEIDVVVVDDDKINTIGFTIDAGNGYSVAQTNFFRRYEVRNQ